ncbi:hypothetical protein C8A00DRAFT_16638 [Chaetomidium leptoderma]|uniref:Rhodopsin domain-containing protein n=1 Tax=Chaetomidium leptoderma TaxID=669021 RepID=A0AAN6VI87_9PEZI|nr:hypothetical protein C8A00DRAFT_16638 [Chaetomidium leptoderma]
MAGPSPYPALDGESRVGEIIAILSVASILSTLTVALRCYSRAVILRSFGLDDIMILPAQALTLASAVAIGLESKYGLGRHVWMMPDDHYIPYMKSFYSSIVVYNVAVCMTKISILLQYRRIFSNTVLRKIIFFGLGFLTLWGITLCFLLPLVCMPVAAFWDPNVKGFCLDNGTIWYVMAGVNVVTDFAIFSMPIPVISSLHLPIKQKAMLLIVFTLGIFPCAVSIYRIRTLSAAAQSIDPTWDNVDAATFSFLELSVGVIAICLPTIRPVLVYTMPRLFGSLLRSGGGQSGGTGPTGGRGSRTPFGSKYKGGGGGGSTSGGGGGGGGSSAARGSMLLKSVSVSGGGGSSTLRGSESTEGLRPDGFEPLTTTPPPRSRMENDLECGELDGSALALSANPAAARRYSVSVVAGWDPHNSNNELGGARGVDRAGIKTTTVVTQKVTFAEVEEEEGGINSRRSAEKDGL